MKVQKKIFSSTSDFLCGIAYTTFYGDQANLTSALPISCHMK